MMVRATVLGLALKRLGPVAAMAARWGRGLALKDHGTVRTLKGLAAPRRDVETTRGSPSHRPFTVRALPWSFRARLTAGATGSRRVRWPRAAALLSAITVALSGCAATGTVAVPSTPPASTPLAGAAPRPAWAIRSVDTMKLSRDTLATPLDDRRIAQVMRLDARLGVTHATVDVYYDAPAYMARWVRAIRAAGLRVWFRAHWYAWDTHRRHPATMSAGEYIARTRLFLQQHAALLRDGDIFDFCSEPENGAYWLRTYGPGWSWHSNEEAKHAFNLFIRAGVRMAATTLAHRGKGSVIVTVVSVNPSVAQRLLSKPTVQKLGRITLDLYPEGKTRDPATAARRLVAQLAAVHRKWPVPIVIGEHGYARDIPVDDATQARVLAAELAALRRLPYVTGLNYWVDAGGPGYGGYTNLYARAGDQWTPRPAAAVLAQTYAATR